VTNLRALALASLSHASTGVWIAFYSDYSTTLRWAVANNGQVRFVGYGEDVVT
jgi:hypothetical protein